MIGHNRAELLEALHQNVVEVVFTKVNGESRTMRCSLREDLLPPSFKKPEEKTEVESFHKTNPETIACWDMVNRGWRSFRVDSVSYAQVIDTQ